MFEWYFSVEKVHTVSILEKFVSFGEIIEIGAFIDFNCGKFRGEWDVIVAIDIQFWQL